jgi:hypothetical protein
MSASEPGPELLHHVELWVPDLARAGGPRAGRGPFAGGPEHQAADLEDEDGFEVEPVAEECGGA